MNFNYILQVVGSFSDSDFVNWASEQKIIQDINQLHFCSSCYNLMKLCYSDRYPDGAIFKCINRTCRNTMSIRFNSWISDAKISLKQFTVILACWSEGLNIKSTHTQCVFHIIRLRLIIFHTPKNFHGRYKIE